MTLHPPFIIGARLAPALKIGNGIFLTYMGADYAYDFGDRDVAHMVMDFPDGAEYIDDRLQSGMQGFGGTVGIFETYLSFLSAALESLDYEMRSGREGENTDLFPRWVLERLDADEIACMRSDLCVEPGSDMANEDLIEEEA